MDDFGQTELTEAFQQRCFDFISKGLEDGKRWHGFFLKVEGKTWEKTWGLLHVPV